MKKIVLASLTAFFLVAMSCLILAVYPADFYDQTIGVDPGGPPTGVIYRDIQLLTAPNYGLGYAPRYEIHLNPSGNPLYVNIWVNGNLATYTSAGNYTYYLLWADNNISPNSNVNLMIRVSYSQTIGSSCGTWTAIPDFVTGL